MTPQQLIGLGLRLCALWLLIASLTFLYSLPRALSESGMPPGNLAWTYVAGAAYLVGSVLLWVFPMAIAHVLIPKRSCAIRMEDPAFALARVASVIGGVFMLAVTGTDLVNQLLIILFNRGTDLTLDEWFSYWGMQIIVYAAAMAFALVLIFCSSLFAQIVSRREASLSSGKEDINTAKGN